MAGVVLLQADQVTAAERLEFWRTALRNARSVPVEVEVDSEHRADFWFRLRYRDLGPVRLTQFNVKPYQVRRPPSLIRSSDPDVLTLGMILRGRGMLDQHRRQAPVPPGSFTLYDATRPYQIDIAADTSTASALILTFPRAMLPLPSGKLERVTGMPIAPEPGVGALTARLLRELVAGMDHYGPAEAARLSSTALEVLATRLAHELGAGRTVEPEAHQRELLARVHAFIQQRLGDPSLTPGQVAAAQHISVRYLYNLFEADGEGGVAGVIQRRRLEACRRDLLDPALRSRPVAAIAARWGLTDPSYFGRLFRAAYGMPPAAYRAAHSRRDPGSR
jgi:AraC-like DNA-binding protein